MHQSWLCFWTFADHPTKRCTEWRDTSSEWLPRCRSTPWLKHWCSGTKSPVFRSFAWLEKNMETKVKHIHSDGAKEFTSMKKTLKLKGTILTISSSSSPQSYRVSEKMNRTFWIKCNSYWTRPDYIEDIIRRRWCPWRSTTTVWQT